MNKNKEALDKLFLAVEMLVKNINNKSDRTVEAYYYGKDQNGYYEISFDSTRCKTKNILINDSNLKMGDKLWVTIPENNINNVIIIGKR